MRAEVYVVALLILIARPAVQAAHVLLLNNAVLPNYGTLFRLARASASVAASSAGFEDDLCRTHCHRQSCKRLPPRRGAVFPKVVRTRFPLALAYLIGAGDPVTQSDWQLLIPVGGVVRALMRCLPHGR